MAESAPVTATDGRLLAGAMASATAEILEKALAAVTGPEADAVRALRPRGELLLRLLGEIGEALGVAPRDYAGSDDLAREADEIVLKCLEFLRARGALLRGGGLDALVDFAGRDETVFRPAGPGTRTRSVRGGGAARKRHVALVVARLAAAPADALAEQAATEEALHLWAQARAEVERTRTVLDHIRHERHTVEQDLASVRRDLASKGAARRAWAGERQAKIDSVAHAALADPQAVAAEGWGADLAQTGAALVAAVARRERLASRAVAPSRSKKGLRLIAGSLEAVTAATEARDAAVDVALAAETAWRRSRIAPGCPAESALTRLGEIGRALAGLDADIALLERRRARREAELRSLLLREVEAESERNAAEGRFPRLSRL